MGIAIETTPQRYRNALIGLAAGDAWGYQVEFRKYTNMPAYPVPAPKKIWKISDDTQMTLALHDALIDAADQLDDVDAVTTAIVERFLEWQIDRDNNRAPGAACMGSLSRLRRGARWSDTGGALQRPGCGAVMRLAAAAFSPDGVWRGITALQAVITHKHPRAAASALVLADAIRFAPQLRGRFVEHAISAAMAVLSGQSDWLRDEYLAEVLSPVTKDVGGYLATGMRDLLVDALLDAFAVKQELALLPTDEYGDPCIGIGEGWESATATALGLLIADMATAPAGGRAPFRGADALGWAATSNGDSDSIASIAGAVIGAAHTGRHYWAQAGLSPKFEVRYAKALRSAPGEAAKSFLR
jgi:ADP-ribosylglycohydrolase